MKICFISPAFPDSIWSFSRTSSLTNKKGGFAPLGLATIAACTPAGHDIALYDEEIEPIPEHTDAEIVAITAYNVQAARAFEIARYYRAQGKLVAIGGAYASLCPEKCQPHADVVFSGEGELLWPQFLSDYQQGKHKSYYSQTEKISMSCSPLPSFERLRYKEYMEFTVQTTRGCPFTCEFCDIIITDGRTPRSKSVEQVIREVEALHHLGAISALFTDANFFGNPHYTKRLLQGLIEFGKARGFPMNFACEATINIAAKDETLALLRAANFTRVFVGIESPNETSLLETKKQVNTRRPLLESIRRLQAFGFDVAAGMIVGFDNDSKDIFQEQFDFLMQAGIAITSVGTLVAMEQTPLYKRLERDNRLLKNIDLEERHGHGASDTNFIPQQMTLEELREGHNWLIRSLYNYKNYSKRLLALMENFATLDQTFHPPQLSPELLVLLKNVLTHYLFTTDKRRRSFFVSTILSSLQRMRPLLSQRTSAALIDLLAHFVVHKHMHGYVSEAHGDPESVTPHSPFASAALKQA
jgi:radical SAM superfamily enzyme YgiQ (UPF0313 family)